MKEKENSKCPNCGDKLKYHPKENALMCESCGSIFEIESLGIGNLDDEEYDFEEMLMKLRESKLTKDIVVSLNCENCGASLRYNENTTSTVCPFCGSSHIIKTNNEEEIIPVSGIIPFGVEKKDCSALFHKWIKRKWFAPNKFKKSKFEISLYPIYLPFWTFDMECYTKYSARRGDYVDVPVIKVDSDGNRYTDTKRELEWSWRSGSVKNSFDDVMVLGRKNQKNSHYIRSVCNYNFNLMEKFNDKFLIGYYGENISLPLDEGFEIAKMQIKNKIEDTIEHDVGGDEVRIISMNTAYSDITFKQVIVPIYNGFYHYKGQKYSFVVNGQTAKFAGGSPVSTVKVTLFVIFIVALFLLPLLLFVL